METIAPDEVLSFDAAPHDVSLLTDGGIALDAATSDVPLLSNDRLNPRSDAASRGDLLG
jgi:hypothetical protein